MGRNATFFLRLSLQATISPWLLLLTRALLPRAATRRLAAGAAPRLATAACSPFRTIPMMSSTSRMVVRGSSRRSRNGCNARSGGPAGSKSVPNAGCGGDCLRSEKRRQTDGLCCCLRPRLNSRRWYYPGNQDPHKSLQRIRSSNSQSRLPRDQRSTTESTEIHGKENPNQLPLSVSFPGAGPRPQGGEPARRVGSFRGYPFVMILLAGVISGRDA